MPRSAVDSDNVTRARHRVNASCNACTRFFSISLTWKIQNTLKKDITIYMNTRHISKILGKPPT